MASLESILQHDFMEFKEFTMNFLELEADKVTALNANGPEFKVSDSFKDYAALVFQSDNLYEGHFRPEAVLNPLARAEENGHYASLVINPKAKRRLFQTEKGTEEYIKLVYREEYIARILALLYLRHKGITTPSDQLWSRFEGNKIIMLTTKPEDALSHYLGYTKAEKDFETLTPDQIKKKLRHILYNDDLSEFKDLYRPQMPQIIELPNIYRLAA